MPSTPYIPTPVSGLPASPSPLPAPIFFPVNVTVPGPPAAPKTVLASASQVGTALAAVFNDVPQLLPYYSGPDIMAYAEASGIVAGDTVVALPARARRVTAILGVAASSGTCNVILAATNALTGSVAVVRYALPAFAGVYVHLRDTSNIGTILDTTITDGSALPASVEAVYSGSAWKHVRGQYPCN